MSAIPGLAGERSSSPSRTTVVLYQHRVLYSTTRRVPTRYDDVAVSVGPLWVGDLLFSVLTDRLAVPSLTVLVLCSNTPRWAPTRRHTAHARAAWSLFPGSRWGRGSLPTPDDRSRGNRTRPSDIPAGSCDVSRSLPPSTEAWLVRSSTTPFRRTQSGTAHRFQRGGEGSDAEPRNTMRRGPQVFLGV